MFDFHGLNEPDRLRSVNEVVRGNLDVAPKLPVAKPDKDSEARVQKIQADCKLHARGQTGLGRNRLSVAIARHGEWLSA
jgi:hypothetical protein